jgi:hypothetical protein
MEYKIVMDDKIIQPCLEALIHSAPLGALAYQIDRDIFYRKTSDGHYFKHEGLDKSVVEAIKILPEISRFYRKCQFGLQVVRILGPLSSMTCGFGQSLDPFDLSVFVPSEEESETIKRTISIEGDEFRGYQHQLWFCPNFQFLQKNTYKGKPKKLLRSPKMNITTDIYGFALSGFQGPFDSVEPLFDLNRVMLKIFVMGYLGWMEENVSESYSSYYPGNFKKHNWSILSWNENYTRNVENNLIQLGLTRSDKE